MASPAARWSTLALHWTIGSAVFTLFGAGLLGLAHTWPSVNKWTHGTLITPMHGHSAFFGAYVMINLAIITFALLYLLPADPVRQIAGRSATPETVENIRHTLRNTTGVTADWRPRANFSHQATIGIDWFDDPQGWHLRDEWLFRGDEPINALHIEVDERCFRLLALHHRRQTPRCARACRRSVA